ADDIEDFEKVVGWAFPPSYLQFLRLHNGWERYRNVYTLIGVSGEHTSRALKEIERTVSVCKQSWEQSHGSATPEAIESFESTPHTDEKTEEGAKLYVANKRHFGTDFAG